MITVSIGEYTVQCHEGPMADAVSLLEHARLSEHYDAAEADADDCCIAVRQQSAGWPSLVVTQRYSPSGIGFRPGVLIVPETAVAFLGAGKCLLCYNLEQPTRLWKDTTDGGLWGWTRHGDIVLMSAELELAAWHVSGKKCWSTYVEPPWTYSVNDRTVCLEIMGRESCVSLMTGRLA